MQHSKWVTKHNDNHIQTCMFDNKTNALTHMLPYFPLKS